MNGCSTLSQEYCKVQICIFENNEEATLNINMHYLFCHQIGDLPDQEAAPEENVLFVCKLNPVTTDEDLEIIFSRFGAIKR